MKPQHHVLRLHENTGKFKIEQDDTLSPKLFTNLLEYTLKVTNWNNLGLNINQRRLNHLRFADDIVLISDKIDKATQMLYDL